MTWTDLLRSAFFGLLQHKLRTLLTLTGVILGSLLLFTTLAGGLGVINAVNDRLSAGNSMLEIRVASGIKPNPVTVEMAREAGFTGEMGDERRIRLAKASGIGGRQIVSLTMENSQQLESIDHVAAVWAELRFSLSMMRRSPLQITRVTIESVPGTDFGPLIVAGRDIANGQTNEILVSELFLYRKGIQTDEQLAAVIGTNLEFGKANPEVESVSKMLARIWYANESNDPAEKQMLADMVGRLPPEIQDDPSDLENRAEKWIENEFANAASNDQQFRVVGVFRRPSVKDIRQHPGLKKANRGHVLMPYQSATDLWMATQPVSQAVQMNVLADQPENVKRVEKAIDDLGFTTGSMAKLAHQIRSAVLLITAIITAIAGGAMLISAIGITNTMVMNVLERRRDIAIMKSIGARNRDINRMFLLEGTLIGVLGGVLGLVLGLMMCHLSGDFIRGVLEEKLNEPFGDSIFSYPVWLIIGTPVIAALVTTIASLVPARRAAKVDPVETLRRL